MNIQIDALQLQFDYESNLTNKVILIKCMKDKNNKSKVNEITMTLMLRYCTSQDSWQGIY